MERINTAFQRHLLAVRDSVVATSNSPKRRVCGLGICAGGRILHPAGVQLWFRMHFLT